MRPVLIFDLDGTLVDSKKDLTASVNYIRNQFDLPVLTEEEIARFIGNGALMLIRRALATKATEPNVQAGLQMFLSYYRTHMLDTTTLYPGVRETLDRLLDCKLAVLTNKPVHFSCAMLDGLGIYRHFVSVYGGNSFDHKKPDPVGVYQILSDTKGQRERTWIVGDSAVDVQTGRNAAIRTCGVTYGYATETFKDAPPDFLIDNFPDLEALVHD
ncbi:MAG TPA: HAD-IA family hydrolase [Terriglobia bacterium]|nr:HAD-IA family hydrolase [Terriglobia bacterium]